MKNVTVTIALLLLCLIPALLMAQEGCTTTQDCKKIIVVKNTTDIEDLENLKGDLKDLQMMKIEISKDLSSDESPDAPFFGIYPAELDFPKAQELNYPYNYGVLITGIVPNSPAYTYRLVEDDIIMEIGGKKALNLKEFDKLKSAYRAGDAVMLSIFRAGEEKRIDFVFGSKEKKEVSIPGHPGEKKEKSKLSAGYGGGTWVPMWYTADMKDVNELVKTIGFSNLPEDGLLTQGIAFKGNVGKGWFIGGQFDFYNESKKINETIGTDYYTNTMDYSMFVGGATLDKRIPITKSIITSLGVMIGGASHEVALVHSNGNYNWPIPTTANPNLSTQNVISTNSDAKIHKGYILVEPRAEVMVRLLSWLGIRGEVGYIYGYAPTSGWKVNHTDDESYEVKNSPDTPFQGMTFTVGPWFGF